MPDRVGMSVSPTHFKGAVVWFSVGVGMAVAAILLIKFAPNFSGKYISPTIKA